MVRKVRMFEVRKRRHTAGQMYLTGKTLVEIGAALGVHESTICRDLEWNRARWLESSIRDLDQARAEELSKIDQLERTYWDAWIKSCGEREMKEVETSPHGDRTKLKREKLTGNPSYLIGIMACINKRCELLGLNVVRQTPADLEQLAATVRSMRATLPSAKNGHDTPAAP